MELVDKSEILKRIRESTDDINEIVRLHNIIRESSVIAIPDVECEYVNRQTILNALEYLRDRNSNDLVITETIDFIINIVKNSIRVYHPHGRWIIDKSSMDFSVKPIYNCSQCNETSSILHWFCPNCGSRMLPKEEEDNGD